MNVKLFIASMLLLVLCGLATAVATANTDNCCFVDRQCSSDQEWPDGYQAFRNNQCPAPRASGAPASPQPAGGVILCAANGVVIGDASDCMRGIV